MSSYEILKNPGNESKIVVGEAVGPFLDDRVGIDVKALVRALASGHGDAAMTTAHSPATAFGSRFWEGAIRQLRDDLIPRGWIALRPGQLEVVRNQASTIQITAAMGDINVGNTGASPSCEHPRGASTARAVEVNEQTFAGLAPDGGWEPIETWWLLYRRSALAEGPLRAELSLPVTMTGSRITDWAIRVLLPSDADGVDGSRGVVLPEAPALVDVPLERRAN